MVTVSLASPAKTAAPSIQAHVIDPNQTSWLQCESVTVSYSILRRKLIKMTWTAMLVHKASAWGMA